MTKGVAVLLLIVLLSGAGAWAGQKIVQIGGGNRIENSQGQIEDNVIWLSRILERSSDDVTTFFAAGRSGVKDVSLYGDTNRDPLLEPLARVLGDPSALQIEFRSNQVPNVSGSTVKDEMVASLGRVLEDLDAGSDLLLIYNGHGGRDWEDVRSNTLKTWQDGRVTVQEVDQILDYAPQESTVRFVFPQCYSGGFYYLLYDDPYSDQMAIQNRCGFFAESAFDESEGCSLDTSTEEYRDYSTYFFAPLNGATRAGEPFAVDPDWNGDGSISFRESHLYALRVADSTDLSRSTAEMYLEAWEPWYLRWDNEENRTSQYWKIAEYVARTHGLSLDGWTLAREKRRLRRMLDEVLRAQAQSAYSEQEMAQKIQAELVLAWPEIQEPYSPGFLALMEERLQEISEAITGNANYQRLIEMQNDLGRMAQAQVSLERRITQIDKVVRMKNLARLEKGFQRFARDEDKRQFERLLRCEEGIFFP